MLLSIDTSTLTASMCLTHNRVLIASRTLEGPGRRHAQVLVPEAGQLLSEQGLTPKDLEAVAVSVGPGSFTGLRVGLVLAKTLAWLNQIPLLAVDTLQALAQQLIPGESIPASANSVLIISDAQRNEVFACEYQYNQTSKLWFACGQLRIAQPAELSGCSVIAGPAVSRHEAIFNAFVQPPLCIELSPQAAAVAAVAEYLLETSQTADPAMLEPVYVRPSYAEEKRAAK